MNDMSSVIVPKSDQINADDFIAGPQTITIRDVQIRGGQEQPVSIYFEGSDKAFRPCKSMSRVLVQAWGPDAKVYVGRSLTLYRDPTVKWGGLEVGGIRISHMSDIGGKLLMQLTATKGQRKPHVVMPLIMQDGPEFTLADAERDLRAAFDLDDLRAIWSRKGMAPFRQDLQSVLDELKVTLSKSNQPPVDAPTVDAEPHNNEADTGAASNEGRSDVEHGDQFDGTLEAAIAELDAAEKFGQLDPIVAKYDAMLSDEDAVKLRTRRDERREEMRGVGE